MRPTYKSILTAMYYELDLTHSYVKDSIYEHILGNYTALYSNKINNSKKYLYS